MMGKIRKLFTIYDVSMDPPELYAWTTEKEQVETFLAQRDVSMFRYQKVEVDAYDAAVWMHDNREQKLIPENLFDGQMDYTIMCTVGEATTLMEEFDNIIDTLISIHEIFLEMYNKGNHSDFEDVYGISEEDLEHLITIAKATTNVELGSHKGKVLNINTFQVFYELFERTFDKIGTKEM